MQHSDNTIRDPFRTRQVEALYAQTRISLTATLVSAAIIVVVFWEVAATPVLVAWAASLGVTTAFRAVLLRRFEAASFRARSADHWLNLFLAGVFVSGAIWGASAILLVPNEEFALYAAFITLWLCGLSAGSVAALSAVKLAFFTFAVPALLPGTVYFLTHNEPVANTLGGAELVFLGFISFNALRAHRTVLHWITLQLRNARLAERLDLEKAQVVKLNQQLERRVSDRTADLFAEKERAQVTLHSIGDAVITTDANGHIDFLNPAAEALTGWSLSNARGQPAEQVLFVVDEQTRRPLQSSVSVCLAKGSAAQTNANAVLIDRAGKAHAISDLATPIRARDGQILGTVLVFSDVTKARQMERELTHQATHDALTGLVNRAEFEHRLGHLLRSGSNLSMQHAVCFLDLDQFKIINDTCGHVAGDALLCQIAQQFSSRIRVQDTLARLGGDEFGVLLEHCPPLQAHRIADTLRQSIEDFRFVWEGKAFKVGVSIGLVSIEHDEHDVESIMCAADMACYAAKDAGRNRVHVYRADDSFLARRHGEMQWVQRINDALEHDRFQLHYQPIVPLRTDTQSEAGVEMLLRMRDDVDGLIQPNAFLPAAARHDLAVEIDRNVVQKSLEWVAQQKRRDTYGQARTFINLSACSLGSVAFLDFVLERLATLAVNPSRICFEINETVAIANLSDTTRFIQALKQRGCRFALDDFGSGLSSFAYLKNLPVDYLKIDGTFIKGILTDPINLAMVRSINDIGHVMGKTTIAECVESDDVLACLRDLGVDFAQGFGLARPQPIRVNQIAKAHEPAELLLH